MRLYSFTEENHGKLARSKVKSVEAGVLYYLFSGRNAWHSTWITRYTEGCMHSDLESAKNTAERQRTQGSVFYIAELPALVFRSAAGAIVVSEINSGSPLSGYSADAIQDDVPDGSKKIKGARDRYIARGVPMLGAALSFDRMSRFWKQRPPWRNAVIVVASDNPKHVFVPLRTSKLQSWRSWSSGSLYRLGWGSVTDRYGNTAMKPVRTLAAHFNNNECSALAEA